MDIDLLKIHSTLIGCDEVGRGPIAGPVNACAVAIANSKVIQELESLNVTDSKKLTEKKRKNILEKLGINSNELELDKAYTVNLTSGEFSFCVTEHTHQEIDEMNILQASLSAMKNASEYLNVEDALILIDGNKTFESSHQTQAVIKGDSKSVVIGLASIIAKTYRDEKMQDFDKKYPGYFLAKNAGYPTKEHKLAVEKNGPSPIHRKSFKGVKEFI